MKVVTNFGEKAPGAEIVSLELAKENSNIDYDYIDDLLQVYLDGVTSEIENYIGFPVLHRDNVEIILNYWPKNFGFAIPVNEITGVFWLDKAKEETEITEFDLFADELVIDQDKPEGFHRLKIVCSAGFSVNEIPSAIKSAALLMFSERETYRENRPLKFNLSAQNLLRPYKLY